MQHTNTRSNGWKLADNYVLTGVPDDDECAGQVLAVRVGVHDDGGEPLPWARG